MTNSNYCIDQQIIDWHSRTVGRYQLAETPAIAIGLADQLNALEDKLFTTIKFKNKNQMNANEIIPNNNATKAYTNHVQFWKDINKITLHIYSAKLLSHIDLFPSFYMAFCCLGSQSPQTIKSKQAIAEFNVIRGAIIGAHSNLQKQRKLYFLYKWAFIVAGLPLERCSKSDKQFNLGVNNVFIFPELDKYNYYLFEPITGLDLAFAPCVRKQGKEKPHLQKARLG